MKISLLKNREDFYGILIRSIEEFCTNYFNKELNFKNPESSGLLFRINPNINLIYPTSLAYSKRFSFAREFSFSNGKIRRILQSLYCRLCISRFFENWFSPRFVSCLNPAVEMKNWAILPGNHTIRIVDFDRDLSFVILKSGFEKKFLKAEVDIRVSLPFTISPRIISVCPNFTWYSEERINGLPLNRISSSRRREKVLQDSLNFLKRVHERTVELTSAHKYLAKTTKALEISEKQISTLSSETAGLLAYLRAHVQGVLETTEDVELQVCQTHGDFQEANILDDGENVWIIDWEYSAVRARFYDLITIECSSRASGSVHLRFLSKFDECKENGGIEFGDAIQLGSAHLLMTIYVVEDVLLRLGEVSVASIQEKELTLRPFLREVEAFLKLTLEGA